MNIHNILKVAGVAVIPIVCGVIALQVHEMNVGEIE
jgi:hypothetical protein